MEVRQLRYTKRSLDDVRSELTSRSNPVDGSLRSSLNSTQVSQRSGKAMSSPRGKEAALSCFWTATEDARHIGNMWLPLLAQTVTAVVLPCLDLAVTCGSYVVTRLRFGVLGARPPPHALHLQRPSRRGGTTRGVGLDAPNIHRARRGASFLHKTGCDGRRAVLGRTLAQEVA